MNHRDVVCPACGFINRDLNLDETEGRFECIYCNTVGICNEVFETYRRGSKAFVIENNQQVRKVTILSAAGGLYKIRFGDGSGSCVKRYRLYRSEEDAMTLLAAEKKQRIRMNMQ